ncbi:MAG: tetratricopeptide repeat protein, partial [Alphaproteobacteria bacterium]|nr:tetratricopeptide repeat protein [Alphaproteobacteria bacterium]
MQGEFRRFFGVLGILFALSGAAWAQAGGSEWNPAWRPLNNGQRGASGAPDPARNASLEALNRILSASQLSAVDRSLYLSIRAFQLNRAGREADSQKDIAEMGRVLPDRWPAILLSTLPELAGGGDRAAALRTLEYGLQRKPGDPSLAIALAHVHMQLAEFQRALALLDGAVIGATGAGDRRMALYYRGHAHFNLGIFQQAADDFEGSRSERPAGGARRADALWRYAALVPTLHDARAALARDIGGDPLSDWPGPIARFLLGRLPAGELEVAAETDDAAKRANGKCPSAFFIGMEAQRRGDRQRAREQFQLAQARCPTISELNWAASSQLKRHEL